MACVQKTKIKFHARTTQKCSPAFLLDCTSFEIVIDMTYRSCLVMNQRPNFHFFFPDKAFTAPFVVMAILGAQHHGNTWILAQHECI